MLEPKSHGTWFTYNERTHVFILKKLSVRIDFFILKLIKKESLVGGCSKRVLRYRNETNEH